MDLTVLENIIIGVVVFLIILALDRIPAVSSLTKGPKALVAAVTATVAVFAIDTLL